MNVVGDTAVPVEVPPGKREVPDRLRPANGFCEGQNFKVPQRRRRKKTAPAMKSQVRTPFLVLAFIAGLAKHPNEDFAGYVVNGLAEGFHLEIDMPEVASATEPLKSAEVQPDIIRDYLQGEVAAGRTSVYHTHPHPFCVEVAVGLVPKKSYDEQKKWRMISHLSKACAVEDGEDLPSVNNHIDQDDYKCEMLRVEEAMEVLRHFGSEAALSIVDVQSGFRHVPIHPSCYHQQCIRFDGKVYIDHRLCFGSRASPKIFDACTSAINYIIQEILDKELGLRADGTRRCVLVHFVDDFCCISEDKEVGARAHAILMQGMKDLGVPLAADKTVENMQAAQYLGLWMDARDGTVTLPKDKSADLRRTLGRMAQGNGAMASIRKKDLESLIGKLSYAHVAFPWLRCCMTPLYAANFRQRHKDGNCNVTADMRESAAVWHKALLDTIKRRRPRRSFNTLPLSLSAMLSSGVFDGEVWCGDAAGEEGFGFMDGSGTKTFCDRWEPEEKASHTLGDPFVGPGGKQSSTLQEAKCLVAAALTWLEEGREEGDVFVYRTDSLNCFYLGKKMRSKTQAVNRLWKRLAERMDAAGVFIYVLWHSREAEDAKLADALSRNVTIQDFRSMAGKQEAQRCQIPPSVRTLVKT